MSTLLTKLRRRRKRYPYPHSVESIGEELGVVDGKQCWWEAKGKAREDYDRLLPVILKLLKRCCEPVSGSDFVSFELYMIGNGEESASPTIVCISEDAKPRKEVMNTIHKDGILKRCSGFQIGNRACSPRMKGRLETLGGYYDYQFFDSKFPFTDKAFWDPSQPIQEYGFVIYFILDDVDGHRIIRPATANVLRHNGRILLQSVSHTLFPKEANNRENKLEDIEQFEILGDSEDEWTENEDDAMDEEIGDGPGNEESEGNLNEDAAATSAGSQTSGSCSANSGSAEVDSQSLLSGDEASSLLSWTAPTWSFAAVDFAQTESRSALCAAAQSSQHIPLQAADQDRDMPTPVLRVFLPPVNDLVLLGAVVRYSIEQDWALIDVTDLVVRQALDETATKPTEGPSIVGVDPIRVGKVLQSSQILMNGPAGRIISGSIFESSAITCLPISSSFQEVYRVELDEPAAEGDSGSQIIDSKTQQLYGVVVAGDKSTGMVYVMPAHHVFKDMKRQLGNTLLLPYEFWRSLPTKMEEPKDIDVRLAVSKSDVDTFKIALTPEVKTEERSNYRSESLAAFVELPSERWPSPDHTDGLDPTASSKPVIGNTSHADSDILNHQLLYESARLLVKQHPERVVDFLTRECGPKVILQLLHDTAAGDPELPQDVGSKGAERSRTPSPLSYFRPPFPPSRIRPQPPDKPKPPLTYSLSTLLPTFLTPQPRHSQPSSAINGIILAITEHQKEPLSANRMSGSYHLIRADIVHNRLKLVPKLLPTLTYVDYNNRAFGADEVVSLTWMWAGGESRNTHQNTFCIITGPLDFDVILGDMEPQSTSTPLLRSRVNTTSPHSVDDDNLDVADAPSRTGQRLVPAGKKPWDRLYPHAFIE